MYLRRIVERDRDLTESTKDLYARGIKTHIEPYDIASLDIRDVTPRMLSDYWADRRPTTARAGTSSSFCPKRSTARCSWATSTPRH